MAEPAAEHDHKASFARHASEMGFNRLVFGVVIALYFLICGTSHALLVTLLCYMGFACLLFAWLHWRPGRAQNVVAGLALIADIGVISLGLHLDGPGDAALFPLYLWVIQGNGFRLGIKLLFVATGLAFTGFGLVIATTPYWSRQPALSLSLLMGLVVLPAYSSTLIRKLSRARQQAEEANRTKSMFLAAISHELRTPLNAILGSVSLVEDTPLNEEQRSLFQAMHAGTQALLSLIGNILDFSRVEAGQMPLAHEPVDLAALLVDIRDLVGSQARMKSLQLSIHVGPGVPLRIMGDRKHLHEVLLNLAANAIKFTDSGGVCLSVGMQREPVEATISPSLRSSPPHAAHAGRPTLRFEVSDTGIGIAPDAQRRIFELFSQADASILDRFGGTGLGLAISRQLVTLMGGEIGVHSQTGQGSTFWFTLGLVEARTEPPRASGTALLLCDDPELDNIIEAALRAQGLTVRRPAALEQLLGAAAPRPGGEILFLYRREPARDLPGDCGLLRRLDPRATLPRILLLQDRAASLPPRLLHCNFIASLTVPLREAELARVTRFALVAAGVWTMPSSSDHAAAVSDDGPRHRPAAAAATRTADEAPGRRSLHVLVADDNEINRRVIGKILERSGHRISLAQDGLQAMDAMDAEAFDLVLMDVNMPQMNGLDATRLFRIAMPPTPRLPILALTADATEATKRKCLQAGMDGCITKPVMPAQLIAAIDRAVGDAGGRFGSSGAGSSGAGSSGASSLGTDTHAGAALASSKPPALDPAVLKELRTLGGDEFVHDLIRDFVSDALGLLDHIDAAIDAGNMTAFRFDLHALCSTAANVGALSLRDGAQGRDISQATLSSDGRMLAARLRREIETVARDLPERAGHAETPFG